MAFTLLKARAIHALDAVGGARRFTVRSAINSHVCCTARAASPRDGLSCETIIDHRFGADRSVASPTLSRA
jgi:hypothetical protein